MNLHQKMRSRIVTRGCSVALATVLALTNTAYVQADTLALPAPSASPTAPTADAARSIVSVSTLAFDPGRNSAPADGQALVMLTGRLLDAAGTAITGDVDVMLTSTLGTFIGTDESASQPGFHVTAKGGTFQAVLQAPVHSGDALVAAYAGSATAQRHIEFTTSLHHGISAGAIDMHFGASHSNYFLPLETFLSDDESTWAYQTSAFAQGPLGPAQAPYGQSQLTIAYDNQNPVNGDCSGLTPIYGSTHEQTSCKPRYGIYGDASSVTHLANSSDNLYVRFEKNANAVQWGDYNTSEFSSLGQTYAATTRELHGAKATYLLGKVSMTGIYATGMQAFQRDIIAPSGTSGSYYLSRRLIVPGSENVQLELEPLDRPGNVVGVTPLVAGVDYDLDPITGSLMFRQPIDRTKVDPVTGAILVQHIVATYQYDGGSGADAVGARLQYALGGTPAEPSGLGFSTFIQNMGVSSSMLTSADLALSHGNGGRFLAEVAHQTALDVNGNPSGGKAFHVEERIENEKMKSSVYVRHADAGFANDAASTSFIAGQTLYGARIDAKVAPRTSLSLHVDQERDVGTSPLVLTDPTQYLNPGSAPAPGNAVDSYLSTIDAGITQQLGRGTGTLGFRANNYSDNLNPTLDTNNSQGIARLAMPLGKRFTVLGEADETLSGTNTALYPAREALGLAYQVAEGIQVGATTQALHGGGFGERHFTSLDTSIDRHLDDNTQLTAKYSLYNGLNGFTAQQEVGLNHHLQVTKHVRGDIGFESDTGSLFNLTGSGMQFAQPYAVGSSTAGLGVSGGTSYHVGAELVGDPDFKAGGRFEHSDSAYGTNNVIRLNAAGTFNVADKLLFSFSQNSAANQLLGAMPQARDLAFGLAVRDPRADNHNWLLMYEFRTNPGLLPEQLLTPGQNQQQNTLMTAGNVVTQDGTLSVEGIESVSPRLELYAKLATRHSQTEISPTLIAGNTIEFMQGRARYEIGQRYDITAEAREILQNVSGFHETGYVGELGYLLSPELRAAVGYSGGWIDQQDFGQGQTRRGIYLDMTMRVQNLWRH